MINNVFAVTCLVMATSPQTIVGAIAAEVVFPATTGSWPKKQIREARKRCLDRLRDLDVQVEALPPIGKPKGCGIAAPVQLSGIRNVSIVPPAELNCALVENLYHWVSSSAMPAAEQHLGKELAQINNASSYACRNRNNRSGGKLSEHATGNAFDISTLQFTDGSAITVKGDWSGKKGTHLSGKPKADFLRRIRAFACIRFSTVLGPGSDPNHGDHFHIDLAPRRSGLRVCR